MEIKAISLARFLLISLACLATTASATTDEHQTKWMLSVPPERPVRIKSDFGTFDVPVGYLNARLGFRQNIYARPNSGPGWDVDLQQSWPGFTFNFWVPDGSMVWHHQPQVRGNRPSEPGHEARSMDSFVVKMHSVERLQERNWRRDSLSDSFDALDTILPAKAKFPDKPAFEGATRDPASEKLLRFYVQCPGLSLCDGWLVIDRRQMAMRVFVPPEVLSSMFAAVRIAARLLDEWEAAAQSRSLHGAE